MTVTMVDLECVRCGAPIHRRKSIETSRIRRGCPGPYCSRSCTFRKDDPRQHPEPDPVPGARWLRLTRGKFALVDEDLFDQLNQSKWHWTSAGTSAGHAAKDDDRERVFLHRVVLGVCDDRVFVDHRDNNGLDCRRSNLRVASRQQNSINREKFVGAPGRKFTSRYKGVIDRSKHYTREYQRKITKKAIDYPWIARIRVNKKLIHLGRFATELEAARAYDAAALQHFGEFARPNFPTEIHPS